MLFLCVKTFHKKKNKSIETPLLPSYTILLISLDGNIMRKVNHDYEVSLKIYQGKSREIELEKSFRRIRKAFQNQINSTAESSR